MWARDRAQTAPGECVRTAGFRELCRSLIGAPARLVRARPRWPTCPDEPIRGHERMEYELTSDAIALGLDGALPATFDLGNQIGEFGRGERSQTSTTDLNVPARLPLEIALTGVAQWIGGAIG